jgi:molecular chaperone GrpE
MSEDKKKNDEVIKGETVAVENDDDRSSAAEGSLAHELQLELTKLRQQLETKEKEAQDYHDRFLRQAAELDNFKKRAARERDDSIRFGNETLIREFLPVIDNLERAIAHAKDGGNGKPLIEGVEMVLKGLFDVLSKHGVMQVSAVGEPFDPHRHEAMAQVESENHEPNTVVEEHHKGYVLHDRLLRPALVTVSKPSKRMEKKKDGGEVENGPADD